MNNEKTFTLNDFNNVVRFAYNRGLDEFIDMYKAVGFRGEDYINEKFNTARTNFTSWWLNLDENIQIAVIEYVKNFYQK